MRRYRYIYVGSKYKDFVTEILSREFEAVANEDNPKHNKVDVDGVTIEVHGSFSDVEISPIEQKAEELYEKMIRDWGSLPVIPYAPYCKMPHPDMNHIFFC